MDYYLPIGIKPPRNIIDISGEFEREAPAVPYFAPISTGFSSLDKVFSGGVFAGHLFLIGGKPNVGKTILALQIARNIARGGTEVVFVCYEHDELHIFMRLFSLESFLSGIPTAFSQIRKAFMESPHRILESILKFFPENRKAVDEIVRYADNLYISQGEALRVTPEILSNFVKICCARRPAVLIVDYLQKIPARPEKLFAPEEVAVKLKEIALRDRIAVVAISALEASAVGKGELSLADLMGDSLVKYEPDAVVMLEEAGNSMVTFRVVKNRIGPAGLSFRHRLYGEFFAFNPSPEDGL